ncbi:hypothetical protein Taro_003577 [Colocasia esculenta]|uniref:Uncharacterized protein n=1 Tax=Colocasia esculenta TaxID=4460 RepID=A0A843TMK0_COLES|nr:hypothetical protein [Colocasia esculenta]
MPCPVATRAVAVPFPVAMVSRQPWGSRQYLSSLGCFRGPSCVSACAPGGTSVCGFPTWWLSRVRGGSACGPSTLCRSEVPVLEVRRCSHLVVPWSRQVCRGLLLLCARIRWFLRESCVWPNLGWWSWHCAVLFRCLVVPCCRTVLCSFLVAVALPSRLRRIAWLPCILVRFPRTICCCPSESFSQDCFALVSAVSVLPQSLRCAVGLAGAFWRVFPERCHGGSGGGSPRACLRCFCSSACCSVLSVGSSQDRPLLILAEVLPRSALRSFRATVVLSMWFEVCCLVGLRSGEVLPGWLLALLVEVLPKASSCCFGCC